MFDRTQPRRSTTLTQGRIFLVNQASLRRKLKELLIERLKFEDMTPEDIGDEEPLFEGGLGLDSIDALEIVVMLETEFDIKVKNESSARESFRSIASLADFVSARTSSLEQLKVMP